MNMEDILNALEDMLEEAWSIPLSGNKCVVDAEKVKRYLQDLRLNLPNEIKQAKMIVGDRNSIIEQAEKQAESTLRKAEERARALVAQEEIVKQAQEKAKEILTQAQSMSKELRRAANEFSDTSLKEAEDALAQALKNVHETRVELSAAMKRGSFGEAVPQQQPQNPQGQDQQ